MKNNIALHTKRPENIENISDLKALQAWLWPQKNHSAVPRAVISETDWSNIVKIINNENLLVEIVNTDFAFAIGMRVSKCGSFPFMEPEQVLFIHQDHLHTAKERDAYPKQLERAWEAFYPVAMTERNQQLVDWCDHVEPVKDKAHYYY